MSTTPTPKITSAPLLRANQMRLSERGKSSGRKVATAAATTASTSAPATAIQNADARCAEMMRRGETAVARPTRGGKRRTRSANERRARDYAESLARRYSDETLKHLDAAQPQGDAGQALYALVDRLLHRDR